MASIVVVGGNCMSLRISTPQSIKPSSTDYSPNNSTTVKLINQPWNNNKNNKMMMMLRPVVAAAAPDRLSEKVAESVKAAEEACSDDPVSGECVAAWDEVEELSAAASHARDKKKDSDPLEEFCKDNMDTDECRTYDD